MQVDIVEIAKYYYPVEAPFNVLEDVALRHQDVVPKSFSFKFLHNTKPPIIIYDLPREPAREGLSEEFEGKGFLTGDGIEEGYIDYVKGVIPRVKLKELVTPSHTIEISYKYYSELGDNDGSECSETDDGTR